MTTVELPPVQAPAPAPVAGAPEPHQAGLRTAAHALGIVAAIMLGFVFQVTVLGALSHDRAQELAYDQFRSELAQGVGPVSPLDEQRRLLEPGTPVAIIHIPRIGVHEVVGEGTSATALMAGPGHQRDTMLPGQAGLSVIMGRRAAYGAPFADLGQLHRNDEIRIITGQGEHVYAVTGVRRAGDPLPPALRDGEGRLVLDTADGPMFLPTDVLRVDARLVSPAQPTNGVVPSFAIAESERVLRSDPSALTGIVLWTAILLVAALGVVYVRRRAGRWHAWIIGIPVLGALGSAVADHAAALLPNLM
ncbi:sortase [Saccharomonospora sp. NPDC046836]|uniref:sortase n=1 Tax=Saccharomonospora sp. NPDC046836 TaxID=3156921 RepID=UPI0033D47A2F